MSQRKSVFKRWDGSNWVEFYFKTSADLIDETASFKVMTAAERTAIGTYLTNGFNTAGLLVQINAANAAQDPGKIDRSLIGDLSGTYLTKSNPVFTGTMIGNTIVSTRDNPTGLPGTAQNLKLQNGAYVDGNSFTNIDGSSITLTQDTINFRLQDIQAGSMVSGPAGIIDFYRELGSGIDYGRAILDFNNTTRILGLNNPTADDEATNKAYVDGLIAEGVKPFAPVKAATTGNITLSGLQAIDGYTTLAGDRILVKNQSTASQNGIYTASATAWTKVTAESVIGALVFVENGAVSNDSKFYAQNDTTWILFSRTDTITASTGLTKVGTDIRVATGGITNAMLAGEITTAKLATFTSLDNADGAYNSWGELLAANTENGIQIKLNNLFSAIGLLRGTANYNTDNTQTIASVNTLAAAKNRTFTFTTATPETGSGQQFEGQTFVAGDLYFQDITPAP